MKSDNRLRARRDKAGGPEISKGRRTTPRGDGIVGTILRKETLVAETYILKDLKFYAPSTLEV